MAQETIEFCGEIKHETDFALLVFDGIEEIWLPKASIKKQRLIKWPDFEFTIPTRLAKKKGIV